MALYRKPSENRPIRPLKSLKEGGKGLHKIAAEHGVGTGTVQRAEAELAEGGAE